MINEITYNDVLEYIRSLCIQNKIIKHDDKSNKRFFTDLDCFKGNEMKSPSVIFVPDTGGYADDGTDSTVETFTARILILGNCAPEDSTGRAVMMFRTKEIADQFAKRILYDSGFETEEVKFVYAPSNRIHKTPVPFDVFADGWGGYELEFTLGAPTNLYVNDEDLTNDWNLED